MSNRINIEELRAKLMDSNHDGRMQSSEFVASVKEVIHQEMLVNIASRGKQSTGLDMELEVTMDQQQNFERVKSELSKHFPGGIENLSVEQSQEITAYAKDAQARMRNATPSDRADAQGQALVGKLHLQLQVDATVDLIQQERRERERRERKRREALGL